ncbi:SMP-30/gluconolactonase/LRE family protein [Entomobacter blattae]|uniref:SMP-30/Gluconolactonase/LRE-like region n=1 Tax=Entomobacter blattae TaxID=2762277 RepID=A0A7H1NS34_9PROT|nr:SMP-30/gluconolactonase/LRE family protein [Entomobacter blattae]QNT78594.1 SMP-30/Gluconolactonase/LRE-like region [Entomobacter blattae]
MPYFSRRQLLQGIFVGTVGPLGLINQRQALAVSAIKTSFSPPSVISNPPRQWGKNTSPPIYPDPDVIIYNKAYKGLFITITALERLWAGGAWIEGPAWSAEGRYVVFSDTIKNVQYRMVWETKQVSIFRNPSFNSNGNAFDAQGRQVSTEDFFRRLVRWEHDGSLTVLADNYKGKRLNSPNDIAIHKDGSIWFTDPAYGDNIIEGHADAPGGPANPSGKIRGFLGDGGQASVGTFLKNVQRELPTATYRLDPNGILEQVLSESDLPVPNGLCFSPDYKTLYIISSAASPPPGYIPQPKDKTAIYTFDLTNGKPTRKRLFAELNVDGVPCGADGMSCDIEGNLWCGAAGPLGYAGVVVYSPKGEMVARIRLPQICSNVTFGGPKRNILIMCAGQSIYSLMVNTQGAGMS